jgi:AcrR family transcriptional regulator
MTARSPKATPARSRVRSPPPRRQVSEIYYSRVLAATGEVVAELGWAHTTVAQIVARAKVSRKTFYTAFRDREDCLLAVFEEAVSTAGLRATQAYEAESSWAEAVRAALARVLEFMDEEPELARICLVETLAAGERVLARRAQLLEQLAGAVDRGRLLSPGDPPPLSAEVTVGGALTVLHTRILCGGRPQMSPLLGPLTAVIVQPYLGRGAANRQLSRPAPARQPARRRPASKDPLEGLDLRGTPRRAKVLSAILRYPGASNHEVGERSGTPDAGQVSKLLRRLAELELIENDGAGNGAVNAWRLTARGTRVERALRPYRRARRVASRWPSASRPATASPR